ncbi:MAG TPA: hypothetical protein VF636_11500 [Sphingomonas sp.]|jgi:hypothetical protein
MDRDPGEFLNGKAVADLSDEEFDSYMMRFPPAPGIVHVDDDAEDDVSTGRVFEHALVSRWLRTAGRPDWRPFKDWLADQDG